MKTIVDKEKLFSLFKELNCGGVEQYDDENQSLIFKLDSNGGPMEDYTLTVIFSFVEYFHLPLSLNGPAIEGYGIDEIRLVSEQQAIEVMPSVCCETMNYAKNDYRCYGFYANGKSSPFYIYCLKVEGVLEKFQNE